MISLINNSSHDNFYNELKRSFVGCRRFYFNVAFVSYSGLQLLLDIFKKAEDEEIKGRIITSTYLNFTDPKALTKIRTFSNIDLKIFVAKENQGFHPKAYIFEYDNYYKIIIGSANITQSALKSNIEWKVAISFKEKDEFVERIYEEFELIWKRSEVATDEMIDRYAKFLSQLKPKSVTNDNFYDSFVKISPNSMQLDAINSLDRLRAHGEKKALAIAATGSGKTYMAAFDVAEVKPKKLLFIVHREVILRDAITSFIKVTNLPENKFGILSGNSKEIDCDYLFAMNISLANNLTQFKKDEFDYIIIDEAHHVSGETYQKILSYFTPKFLLGMTATPERGDANSIYEAFDNNIAIEIRLRDALEQNLVVPFHYFGITEAVGTDYTKVDINNIAQVAKLLQTHKRVDHIIEQMGFYGFDGKHLKAIGFCLNVEHAVFMAKEFNSRGIQSVCLTGASSELEREEAIANLEDSSHPLQVIFTVDIFNEGVDIPSINLVLMLRPTESPIVFIQQLGRGLRKHHEKSFLTVLDFIGNHKRSFLIAIALCGRQFYDKDSLMVSVLNDFANIPGCTHIQLDEITKEQILKQIENENFNSFPYLKEEFNNFLLLWKKFNKDSQNSHPMLKDFFLIDGTPDPTRYIKSEKTYLGFLDKIERDNFQLKELLANSDFIKIQRFLDEHLAIKRINEFVILLHLLDHDSISLAEAKNKVLTFLDTVDEASILHSYSYLEGKFFDSNDLAKFAVFGQLNNDAERTFVIDAKFKAIRNDLKFRLWIEDSIYYGIYRYENEFGSINYGTPFLKLYQQYNMRHVALVAGYDKKHSAFRGQGLLTFGNDYFLFIELHKQEGAIAYKDKFISAKDFQWESPNSSNSTSGQGFNIIKHQELNIKLHLFVRKFKEIDGVVQPYIYIGKANVVTHEGERPIQFQMVLENEVPASIYAEFDTDTRLIKTIQN